MGLHVKSTFFFEKGFAYTRICQTKYLQYVTIKKSLFGEGFHFNDITCTNHCDVAGNRF